MSKSVSKKETKSPQYFKCWGCGKIFRVPNDWTHDIPSDMLCWRCRDEPPYDEDGYDREGRLAT